MKSLRVAVITVLVLQLITSALKAQQVQFAQDVNGSPIRVKQYTDVNGSPYLTDTWEKAIVQLQNGQTYSVDVKYDLVSDELTFKTPKGDSLNFANPVKEFKLSYSANNQNEVHLFRSGFPSTSPKTSERSFYEVLYDGSTKLLKKQAKSIWTETTSYGTATITKNITSHVAYFVSKGGKMILIKNDKKSVTDALNDKATQLEQYLKDNKINFKSDGDLIKVFAYYNSLQ